MDQVAGYVLSAAVAHPAGVQEFAHVGVYKGIAGFAVNPFLEFAGVFEPRLALGLDARRPKDAVAVFERHELEVVAPNEFEDQPVGALVLDHLLLVVLHFPIDLLGRQTAVGQPWAELGRVVRTDESVARVLVFAQGFGVPEVVVDAVPPGLAAAFERQRCARIGIGMLQTKVFQLGNTARRRIGKVHVLGKLYNRAHLGALFTGLAELGEDIGDILDGHGHILGVEQGAAVLQMERQLARNGFFHVHLFTGVLGLGKDLGGVPFVGQLGEDVLRQARADDQLAADFFELGLEVAYRFKQELRAVGSGFDVAPLVGLPLARVKNVDRQYVFPCSQCAHQAGVVIQAQIVAKPIEYHALSNRRAAGMFEHSGRRWLRHAFEHQGLPFLTQGEVERFFGV